MNDSTGRVVSKQALTDESFDEAFLDRDPCAYRVSLLPVTGIEFDPGMLIVSATMGTIELNVMDGKGRRMDVFIDLSEARGLLFRLNRAIRDAEVQKHKWESF